MGMRNWKKAKVPAMRHILDLFMLVSLRPLARETEKASMARPAPRQMLVMKKAKENIN